MVDALEASVEAHDKTIEELSQKERYIASLLQRIEELAAMAEAEKAMAEQFRKELADQRNIAEAAVAMLQVCQADLRECQREKQRLREALQRIADGRADEWFNWGEWARQALEAI